MIEQFAKLNKGNQEIEEFIREDDWVLMQFHPVLLKIERHSNFIFTISRNCFQFCPT